MNQSNVRDNLRTWLDDLAKLKDHVDPGNPLADPFNKAWEIVLEKAKQAAIEYARTFN